MYPYGENKKFDIDYWIEKHRPMVLEKLEPHGLVKLELDKGITAGLEGGLPIYLYIGYLYFNSMEDHQKCLPYALELFSDLPNFTDIEPITQVSEIIQQ
jgi:uncharacterized protein (TIGR02118 family)